MKISNEYSENDILLWVVEDNEVFRTNISGLIDLTEGIRCEHSFRSCEDMIAALDESIPDALLMDIGLPGMDGIEGVHRVKSIAPAVKVIMLTVFDDHDRIFRAICAGASGYLLKGAPIEKIIESLCDILSGGAPINAQIARKVLEMFSHLAAPQGDYHLTTREKEILTLLVDGKTKKFIAAQIHLSFHTIDSHLRNIYTKLHVHSRSGAIAKVLRENIL
jgi:DNA-binding NarL/FixJ family response regulator